MNKEIYYTIEIHVSGSRFLNSQADGTWNERADAGEVQYSNHDEALYHFNKIDCNFIKIKAKINSYKCKIVLVEHTFDDIDGDVISKIVNEKTVLEQEEM